jgi:hypothetical protein
MLRLLSVLFFLLFIQFESQSQKLTNKEIKYKNEVWEKTQQLSKAMVDADSIVLDALTDNQLSYGHSSGSIDNKKKFIHKFTSGSSDFVEIKLEASDIIISGKTAIVRHDLNAKTLDNHVPGEVHLKVMLVWQLSKKKWKLLARQAVKITK